MLEIEVRSQRAERSNAEADSPHCCYLSLHNWNHHTHLDAFAIYYKYASMFSLRCDVSLRKE